MVRLRRPTPKQVISRYLRGHSPEYAKWAAMYMLNGFDMAKRLMRAAERRAERQKKGRKAR